MLRPIPTNLNKKIYAKIEAWRNRRIEGEHPYLDLDGIVMKRTWAGEVRNVSLLVASAVNSEGFREILGICEGAKEDKSGWSAFLRHLVDRGLQGVQLIISDACRGLTESAAEYLPEARWQRCMVHFYRNVFSHVPATKVREVSHMLKAIHAQESREAADRKARAIIDDLRAARMNPAAMRIGTVASEAGVEVNFRPFLLGPIFKAQGWETSPFNLYPAKGRNMWRDLERTCADLALPFRRPEPFPQSSVLAARVALVGLADTWGRDFCRAVYRAEFADGARIDDPQSIRAILSSLNVDADTAIVAAHAGGIKEKLRAETAEAQRLGIFGAPSFTTADGELFWGNDRLERAVAWAKRPR